ncbi:MAG: flagellin [Solibacillus sp.]
MKWNHVDGAATGWHLIKDAVATEDGGIIAGGNYQEDTCSKGYLYKLNANGQKEWEKKLDESSGLGSIIVGNNGDYLVGGDTNGTSKIFAFDGDSNHQMSIRLTDTNLQSTVSELIQRLDGQFVAANSSQLSIFNVPNLVGAGEIKTKQLVLQIGANTNQHLELTLQDISSNSLNLQSVSLLQQQAANDSISILDQAINSVSSFRGNLGAIQNRLAHAYEMTIVSAENLQAAEATIRDADMAKQMMNYTKQSILVNAAQSLLAQANQQPTGVLSLLG